MVTLVNWLRTRYLKRKENNSEAMQTLRSEWISHSMPDIQERTPCRRSLDSIVWVAAYQLRSVNLR